MKNFKKSDLFNYLDGINFVEFGEVEMAINDFFRDYVEKDENFQPSRGELAYYSELAEEYINKKQINLPIFLPF